MKNSCIDCGGLVPDCNLKCNKQLCGKCNYQRYGIKSRQKYSEKRQYIIDHYGNFCVYCGANENLQIDHKNGDGKQHRKKFDTRKIWINIIKDNFPDTFQILCRRCNTAKGHMNDQQFKKWVLSINANKSPILITKIIKEYTAKERKNYYHKRDQIINHYGNVCVYCSSINNLEIDHKDGNGKQDRLLTPNSTRGIWKKIITSDFPEDYQISCHQCNLAKGNFNDKQFKDWINKIISFSIL